MLVKRPLSEISLRARAERLNVNKETIDRILEFYEDHIFDKLSKGEEIKLKDVGKITPSLVQGSSMLTGNKKVYETVKFKFTPFSRLKSVAKEKIVALQKKHL